MGERRAEATMVSHHPCSGGSMGKIVPKGDFFHRLGTTAGLGLKLSPFFGFAKTFKYKTNFPLSLLPKSVVVAVSGSLFSGVLV